MSISLINTYLNELDILKKVSGSLSESVLREAFKDLLKAWAKQEKLVFIAEIQAESIFKNRNVPDGTILFDVRLPLGYWEAKDTQDDLEEEIRKKFAKGYPQDNIIFEDTQKAVLFQDKQRVFECEMTNTK